MVRVLRSEDYRRMPWKNGKGETVEIAVFPPDARLDAFDWRISMATVAEHGDFSLFPDIDRTLSILQGNGMALSIEGRDTVVLDLESEPHAFPADVRTSARLVDGTIVDLNVMTRRGRFTHVVHRLSITSPVEIDVAGQPFLLFCRNGAVETEIGTEVHSLATGECLLIEEGGHLPLRLAGNGMLFAIALQPA